MNIEPLIPGRFLFRLAIPCRYRKTLWSTKGISLRDSYKLENLGELENKSEAADIRAAWNETGFAISVNVVGKKQPIWCRPTRPEDSDGLQVWIDTRDVHNVHRASRFCHRFLFMPVGSGRNLEQPVAQWLPINRARQQPQAIPENSLKVRSETRPDGYLLEAFIGAEALSGFEPAEHPKLGFNYSLTDRDLGQQTLSVGSPMRFEEDPSLWVTLELVR